MSKIKSVNYSKFLFMKAGLFQVAFKKKKKRKETVLQSHCRWQCWLFPISQARLNLLMQRAYVK